MYLLTHLARVSISSEIVKEKGRESSVYFIWAENHLTFLYVVPTLISQASSSVLDLCFTAFRVDARKVVLCFLS